MISWIGLRSIIHLKVLLPNISNIKSGKMEIYVEMFNVRGMLDEVCAAVQPVAWLRVNALTMTID